MSEVKTPPPNKKDLARALLLRGSLFVHLDPRPDEVRVPNWLKNQPQLVLQVGLDMPIPVPDLRVDDVGVYATLSFNRAPFTCVVPWNAVFAMVGDDGKGMVWPEDMPPEIAAEVEREARRRSKGRLRPAGKDELDSRARERSERSERESSPAPASRRAAPPELKLASDARIHGVPDDDDHDEDERESGEHGEAVVPLGDRERAERSEPRKPSPRRSGKKGPRELPPYLRVVK